MKSTNPSQIANRTAALIANTIDLKGEQVAGLALTIQAAIDEASNPLREILTETRTVLDLIVAEWDSDVRSTQCFDSRIITNSRMALRKADSVL